MKTKLLAIILLAGGSMFAQTRVSRGADTQTNGYRTDNRSSYSGYQVGVQNQQRGYNSRSVNQYSRTAPNRSFERGRAFSFGQYDFQGRGFNRNNTRGPAYNYGQVDRDGNRFNGR